MKKLLLILFIFSIIILPAYSNNQITKDESEIIEQKYSQCIDNSSVINYPNCAYEYGEKWKTEIDKYYRLLKKEMSKNDFKIIEKSQEEWGNYVNTQTKVIDKFITNQDGIIYQTIGQSKISQLYKERALLLKDILHHYEENKFTQFD